ncbi:MAG: Chromosome partition protein Smc [Mycoplasmataceae bacterium]|nr:MAG: Chromosome partition protein Smc [Mycoplasmataceae bacterium]
MVRLNETESNKVKKIIEDKVKSGKLMMSKKTEHNLTIIYNPMNKGNGSDFHLTIVNWRRLHWTHNGKLKNIRIQINGDLKIEDLENLDIEWALELQKELKGAISSKSEKKQEKKKNNKEIKKIIKKNGDAILTLKRENDDLKKKLESEKADKNELLKQIKAKDIEISELKEKVHNLENKSNTKDEMFLELERKIQKLESKLENKLNLIIEKNSLIK